MIRAEQFWRVECATCDARIEDRDLFRLREIEAEGWDRVDGANYCPACLRAARLAHEQMVSDGEKASLEGGQAWAEWTVANNPSGD